MIDINRYLSYTLDSFLQQDYSPVSFISRFCASFMMVTVKCNVLAVNMDVSEA